ncbi:DUF4124 domain-containing protein [Massilia soli]|uniref:DUF4124 domain-containing protein n=1 Tax=Massilia soli TaxID=2792854 RepID=A0ABS7SQD8_9BURK|nr:DUF4124 domain-containing protein [Massilia soli]MBZ2207585.1 DUF4124 domain-containing protein [Massilia soli]
MSRALVILAGLALCAPAPAQSIYKCSSNGKVTYSEQPCSSGTQAMLDVPPAPPPDPELKQRLARQKALAESLDKERREASALAAKAARPPGAARATPQQQRCDKLRLQLKWAQDDLRKSAGPATEAMRIKVERQAEAMAVECQR